MLYSKGGKPLLHKVKKGLKGKNARCSASIWNRRAKRRGGIATIGGEGAKKNRLKATTLCSESGGIQKIRKPKYSYCS
jgi:hypothetical protein